MIVIGRRCKGNEFWTTNDLYSSLCKEWKAWLLQCNRASGNALHYTNKDWIAVNFAIGCPLQWGDGDESLGGNLLLWHKFTDARSCLPANWWDWRCCGVKKLWPGGGKMWWWGGTDQNISYFINSIQFNLHTDNGENIVAKRRTKLWWCYRM